MDYAAPPRPAPDVTAKIDYAAHGQIRFRSEAALAAQGPGKFPATFFHLGMFFQKSVKMHAVKHGEAREIVYRTDYFDMPTDSVARRLPEGAGFACRRIATENPIGTRTTGSLFSAPPISAPSASSTNTDCPHAGSP